MAQWKQYYGVVGYRGSSAISAPWGNQNTVGSWDTLLPLCHAATVPHWPVTVSCCHCLTLRRRCVMLVSQPLPGSFMDVFTMMMDWTIRDVIRPTFERGVTLDGTLRIHILDNCQKVRPISSSLETIKSPEGRITLCQKPYQYLYCYSTSLG